MAGLYPDGQLLFYKGGDPGAFRQEVKERLGLDPADDDRWELTRQFWCPARMLDVVLTNYSRGGCARRTLTERVLGAGRHRAKQTACLRGRTQTI